MQLLRALAIALFGSYEIIILVFFLQKLCSAFCVHTIIIIIITANNNVCVYVTDDLYRGYAWRHRLECRTTVRMSI